MAKQYALTEVTILFNPGDCTAIYAVNPRTDELIKLDCKMLGVPAVSFEVIKILRKTYGRPIDGMQAHDYQRVYAQLLQKWSADSRKKGKARVKDNNKAARDHEREKHYAQVEEQLQKALPVVPVPTVLTSTDDDYFEPAPREDLSHE